MTGILKNIENKLKAYDEKQIELEHKITCLSNSLDDKTEMIENLEMKVYALEKNVDQVKEFNQSMTSLKDSIEQFRVKIKEIEENNFVLIHAVDDVEKATKSIQNMFEEMSVNQCKNIVCYYCDKQFEKEEVLKIHTRIDHGSGRIRIKR